MNRFKGVPLHKFLKRLHPSYKDAIINKLNIIIKYLNIKPDEINNLTLDDCLKIYGIVKIRETILNDVYSLIIKGSGLYLTPRILELESLREEIKKQSNLSEQLIKSFLYKLSKEKENEKYQECP